MEETRHDRERAKDQESLFEDQMVMSNLTLAPKVQGQI